MVVIRRFGRYRYVCGIWRFLSCQYCGVSVRFGSGCDTSCRIPATPAAQAPTSHTPPAGGDLVVVCLAGCVLRYSAVRIGSISSVRFSRSAFLDSANLDFGCRKPANPKFPESDIASDIEGPFPKP